MHRLVRNKNLWNLSQGTKSIRCRDIFYPPSKNETHGTAFSSFPRRETESSLPITEKIRRKIWGTDKPPGPANPYDETDYLGKSKPTVGELIPRKTRKGSIIGKRINDYEPAVVWDGLEQVGGPEDMWVKEWLPGNTFQDSFIPKETMTDTVEITATVRRALVEIFACCQANQQLTNIFMAVNPPTDLTVKVQMTYSPSRGVILQYPDETTRELILHSLIPERKRQDEAGKIKRPGLDYASRLSTSDSLADPELLKIDGIVESETTVEESPATKPLQPEKEILEGVHEHLETSRDSAKKHEIVNINESKDDLQEHINYKDFIASWDPSWVETPITDPEIKFIFIKRIIQLSGIRIPDPVITSATTAGFLLGNLVKPPKSRKLAEVLMQNKELSTLPNVSIHSRRITLRDKETRVGRWKLIEEEFRARGLTSER